MTGDGHSRPLIEIEDLEVAFPSTHGWRNAVDGVGLRLHHGERVGLVGESGSGKSLLALACLGLVPPPGRIRAGRIAVEGVELGSASAAELCRIRGGVVGLVMQEPAAALNPVYSVGFQLEETIRAHRRLDRRRARAAAIAQLSAVRLDEPETMMAAYPHQLSGGQAQRVLLALALAGDPLALITDEATTALDVTTQAEVLGQIDRWCSSRRMALLLVSHDLAVVAGMTERVMVMLAGEIVEEGPVAALLERPLHPFTRELLASRPGAPLDDPPAGPHAGPTSGCRFSPRCPLSVPACRHDRPRLLSLPDGRSVRCPVTTAEGRL